MKRLIFFTLPCVIMFTFSVSAQKAGKIDNTKHTQFYTCPMHDSIASTQAGNCRICGMKLTLSKKEAMKAQVTKNYSCPLHITEESDKPGKCSKCGKKLTNSAKENMKVDAMNNYTCPMHGDIKSDKPGKCPNCGMVLSKAKSKE
ncbi:MAG: heavy metal-binding domain-containing protein [Bacteroidota bacterium]